MTPQDRHHGFCRTVPAPYPDYFWRVSEEKTSLIEVSIFRNNDETVVFCVLSDQVLATGFQPNISWMCRIGIEINQCVNELVRNVFIEK